MTTKASNGLAQKGDHQTKIPEVSISILTAGNILLLFCHVGKPLKPILPILCVCEKPFFALAASFLVREFSQRS